jgi:hypothetical protein
MKLFNKSCEDNPELVWITIHKICFYYPILIPNGKCFRNSGDNVQ